MRPVLAVVGPTCTGKTTLAVELAKRIQGAELINADSRQVIRGLQVGTCAPTDAELQGVAHHLFGVRDPGESFTVADWATAARSLVAGLRSQGALPVVVGGTGLYVSALVDGFDFANAPPDPARRAEREREAATPGGPALLAAELVRRDPDAAALVDLDNARRVIRALEIVDARPEGLARARGRSNPVDALLLGLDLPRDVHDGWIRVRARGMVASGALLEEVRRALARGVDVETLAACGIGYAEAIDVLHGGIGEDGAIERISRRTQRYARAQRTYWRRDPRIRWLDPRTVQVSDLISEIAGRLS